MEKDRQIYDNYSKIPNSTEVNSMGKPTELDQTTASLPSTNLDARESGENTVLDVSLPNDISVYRQDVVKCYKYESLQGVVLEVAGDSDSDESISDDDVSGEEEDRIEGGIGVRVDKGNGDDDSNAYDVDDTLPEGQVRVAWTSGTESAENICDITVTDRSFLHGDIVASASNPTGQLGLVVDIDITVDLLSASGQLIKDISSRDIKRISEFSIGDFVVFGPWLGRVDEVLDNVTVLFDDGSVCKVAKADPLRLKPVLKPTLDDADCPYYPGQRVKAVSSSVFKASRWLSGFWKANRLEGTVIRVQTASVVVYWIASAYLGVGTNSTTVPPEEQNPKNLTLLSCFSYANWQLCDWCLLPTSQQLLPSDSSTLESGKTTETVKGYDSIVEHVDNSGYASDIPKSDNTIYNSSRSSIISDALCHQASSEHMDSSESVLSTEEKDGTCKLHSTSNLNIDKTNYSSENQLSDSTLLEQCSCSNSLSVSKDATNESWPSYRKKLRKVLFKRDKKARKRDETFEKAFLIGNTVTKVDVAWQDGNIERRLPSTSLIPIHSPNENEFFPEQYVVEKASNEDGSLDSNRVGIVRSVNALDRTVCVRWLKPVSRPEELREFDCEEVVSSYELDLHPDYDYCYGDVVVRLPSVSGDNGVSASHTKVKEKQDDPTGTQDLPRDKHKGKDKAGKDLNDESHENFTSLSWVGNITGLQDGDIEVTWADGMVSKVGPQEVFVVGRDDDGDSFDGGSEVSNGGASWETVDDNEMEALDVSDKEIDSQSYDESTTLGGEKSLTASVDLNEGQGGPLSMPLAALGYVTRFATGLFSRSRNHSDSSGSDQIMENDAESQAGGEVSDNSSDKEANDDRDALMDELQNHHAETIVTNVEEMSYIGETTPSMDDGTEVSCNINAPHDFKHFDVAVNPSDHHFLNDAGQNTGGRKWVKKVQQEWSILEKNLPDDVYVRVFEDRMDLLRAVIVGACGTPYHDGLFFFDFHLPPDYPQVPPTVYYHSGGLRINPNLYVDGKVCLSLLNTWTGKGNEVWDPSTSSILQVLVSLQGLVLNSKPYFNEAGYDKQVGTLEGEKNSLPYNENTYLLNLKSMIYLLRRPPRHFEKLVEDHFRSRGHYILKACEAYKAGSLIGSLTEDACRTEKSREHPCSVGFKLTLAKILPRLITALSEVGVDCHQFDHICNPGNIAES